jgi:DNA-directed RNA polymerase subunit alpha
MSKLLILINILPPFPDKKTEFSVELDVEKGIGYVPVEQRQKEKLAIGVIAIDAIFSPVHLVNFKVEDVRVGQRIDFNKVTMDVETDGSIEPEVAMKRAAEILIEHFRIVNEVAIPEAPVKKEPKAKKTKSK